MTTPLHMSVRLSQISDRIIIAGQWREIKARLLALHGIEPPSAQIIPFPVRVAS